jgi:hypothetical protein
MSAAYVMQEDRFATVHPDTVGPFVEIMLRVYTSCQRKTAVPPVDLEAAHSHVFGNKDLNIKRCDWCFETFETRRDFQEGRFVNDPSISRMREILGIDFDQYQEERRQVLESNAYSPPYFIEFLLQYGYANSSFIEKIRS